jgi:DNA anti-recombination protein RmuC
MNRTILTITFLLFSLTVLTQTPDSATFAQLQECVGQLQTDLKNQKRDFSKQISATNKQIDTLQMQITERTSLLADSLGTRITDTRTNAEQQIENINKSVGKETLFSIISGIVLLLLSVLLFWILRKKQKSDKIDLVAQLTQTKQSIDENLVQEFTKISESLDALSKISQPSQTIETIAEPDHSLALKVASEINLIERNINLMDAGTKGLKQLVRSVGKLKDNLSANGYEIPVLLGKHFHQGMKVIVASSIPNEKLEKGSEIITKILIPQVNYNGVMIQSAQIEVSVG